MIAVNDIAVVTGGTKGIGKQIVIKLLERGYFVYTNYASDENASQQAEEQFSSISNRFTIMKADQSNQEDFDRFIEHIKMRENKISCVVCNTGTTLRKSINDILNADWEKIMQVNVNSHFYLVRDIYSLIGENSRIIFISSVLGDYPHASSLAYGVSKASLISLAKNLVKCFEGTGTTVNAVLPGFTTTDWQKEKPQVMKDNIVKKIALHRFALPEEIAQTCMFCIDNPYINGAGIEVNGGYCFK